MKKLISIILTVMLALSVSITAFAAEREATPDTSDFEYQVKEAVVKKFYEGRKGFDVTADDICFIRSATLSDGRFYFSFLADGVLYPGVSYEETIGDYYYYYSAGLEVYLYNAGEIIEINDAYEAGIINDDILAELSAFGYFGIEPMNDVPDTSDFEYQVKEAVVKKFFEGPVGDGVTADDIHFSRSATLSDGRFYFIFWASGIATLDVFYEETIGDYYYYHNCGEEVYLYNAGEIIEINDAYEAGIINDDILAELSAFGYFGIVPMNPAESEPVTQPQTENIEATKESATQPQMDNTDATSATKAVPSNSISTIDTPSNVKSNGTVQTGQSNFAILTLLIVMALAGAAAAFSKYAYRK